VKITPLAWRSSGNGECERFFVRKAGAALLMLEVLVIMNSCASTRQTKAFTLIELFVIVVILALLVATLVPAVAASKRKAQRIKCTNNLKHIGLSFRLFSTDHGDKFPETTSTNKSGVREYLWQSNFVASYFCTLSNELAAPKILLCPTDTRKPAINYAALTDANVSYFAGLDADETSPSILLAGDRNLTINGIEARGGIVEIHPTDHFGWSKVMHLYSGNVALGDGSVQNLSLGRSSDAPHGGRGVVVYRLAIPE
jgi:type II secretory pathway pseudopilin PulG